MGNPAAFQQRRLSLQLKLVAGLLVIVLTPLAVAAYLIDGISDEAAVVGRAESEARDEMLRQTSDTLDELVNTAKAMQVHATEQIAAHPQIAALDPEAPLDQILETTPYLVRIELLDPSGKVVAERARSIPDDSGRWREFSPAGAYTLPGGGGLRLSWHVLNTQEELRRIGRTADSRKQLGSQASALSEGYRRGFLGLVGAAALIAVAFGVLASQRVTRRIAVLVEAARRVAAGDGEARAGLRGRDEMAELAFAFNAMLDGLDRQRREIEYLQRIGAWQDVARKLAHEIKNPLTPIQLAVQQCVSAYKGDDGRFKRLLADTGEIVEEEIGGLRRLVDTFRTLGQLPRVEAHPILLREVIAELRLDPALAERMEIVEPTAGTTRDVSVRADKLLLKRVLTNLVENGIHAGKEAGKPGDVRVGWSLAPDGRAVAIAVEDEGKGVAADARERIFEPYVTTKATGTGLGLAIAKKIALEHGGTLDVMPERAASGGARFVLALPLAP